MTSEAVAQQVQVSRVFDRIREAAGPFLTEAQREAIIASGQTIPGKRHIVNSGSTRSTKTYSIIQFCIAMCLENPGLQVAFIRAKLTWLRKSAYKDFINVMRMMGLWDSDCMNKSDWEYTFENGSQIFFIGLDQDAGFAKAHGLKTDIAFLNEITELGYEHVRQIDIRCTWLMIYDFNPNCPSDYWIYSRVLSQENSIHIHSTYKENKWLERRIVETIESYEPTPENIARGTADETFWKIYGLGLQGIVKGLIFPNFRIVKDFPDKIEKPGYAMDYGFTNDPTTLVFCGQTPGNLWFDEMLYERDLVNLCVPNNPTIRSIEGELLRLHVRKNLPIYCDSAEPKSIRDIQNAGFRAEAVTKGPGSVVAGLIAMKRFIINVTERSMNLINELQNYKWKDQKGSDGEAFCNEPVGAFDHVIDACLGPGTLITTKRGDVPIEDVLAGDYVQTRTGWGLVEWSGMTRPEDDILELQTSDGASILGTGDHRIFTRNRGFVYLRDLTPDDILWSIKEQEEACCERDHSSSNRSIESEKSSNLMGSALSDIQKPSEGMTASTSMVESVESESGFISISGVKRMGAFRKAWRSITSIAIPRTMTSLICLASPVKSTCLFMVKLGISKKLGRLWLMPESLRMIGMDLKMERSGIANKQNELVSVTSHLIRFVSGAARSLSLLMPSPNSVASHTRLLGSELLENTKRSASALSAERSSWLADGLKPNAVRVVAVISSGKRMPVYDLTISVESPEFFANGILVHNCRYYTTMCEPGSLVVKSQADLMGLTIRGRSRRFDPFGGGDEEGEAVDMAWRKSLGCGQYGFSDFAVSEKINPR